MNSRCADCNHEDCQCDRPPMPAAGVWRTDVENAPRGVRCLVQTNHKAPTYGIRLATQYEDGWFSNFEKIENEITAFAELNPPETPNA